jgi:Arc-like DNA binding domain
MADRESVIQVKFRLRRPLLKQLKRAADAADRSLNEEIEERLKQSFQLKELQEAFEKGLMTRLDVARDEIWKKMKQEMQEWRDEMAWRGDEMARSMGLPEDFRTRHAGRPGLLGLAGDTERPSEQPKGQGGQPRDLRGTPADTSEPSTTEDDSGGKQ